MSFFIHVLTIYFFIVSLSAAQSDGLIVSTPKPSVTSDYSDTSKNITSSIPLCPESHQCPGDCQSATTGCKCDNLCILFGDCCLDSSCSPQDASISELNELNIDHAQIGCVVPTLDSSSFSEMPLNGFYMVDKCPGSYLTLDLVQQCLHPNKTDLQSTIPVTEQELGVTFRNIYCALCNNIPADNVVWWQLQAHCGEDILPLLQTSLANGASLAETLTVINEFCPISFGSPGKFASSIGSRPCYSGLINSSGSCLPETMKETLIRCEGYMALVIDDQGQIYHNPDCYICSHKIDKDNFEVELDCEYGDIPKIYQNEIIKPTKAAAIPPIEPIPPGAVGPIGPGGIPGIQPGGFPGFVAGPEGNPGIPGLPGIPDIPDPVTPPPKEPDRGIVPISVIVDFSSNSGVTIAIHDTIIILDTITCDDDEVYDPFADTCRVLSCSEGYALIGGQCVFMPSGTEHQCIGDFVISANTTSDNCVTTSTNSAFTCLQNVLTNLALMIKNDSSECLDNGYSQHTFIINSTTSFTELEKVFDSLFLRAETDTSATHLCNVNNFNLNLNCDAITAGCEQQVALTDISIEQRNNRTIIHTESVEYLFLSGSLSLQYELESVNNLYDKLVSAKLCDTSNVSCPLITLNASLFIPYSDSEILLESTGELFAQHEYKYTSDGQIQICSVFERNGTRNETRVVTFIAYDTAQTILSLIGSIISMIALVLTFVTYVVFASLRTPAIKAIMNLVVALFMAQLLFLFGAGLTENANLCTFVAVLLHYLWLSTFTWSTVLSFDLNLTFSNKLLHHQQDKAPIYPYLLYGWSAPLVVIIPCLVIHLCACTDIPFSYGTRDACWIYNQYANLIVFGAPLVVCLMINCVFFFNILWNIHKTKKRVRSLKQGKSRVEHIKEELSIYVKIASLMGFTWIFAFSAAFSGVSALWYIYIIVNSLQGLYIFFAFTFNRRIGKLWKNKITGSKLVEHLFESSTTKTGHKTDNNPNARNGDQELKDQTTLTLLSANREKEEKSSISSASRL